MRRIRVAEVLVMTMFLLGCRSTKQDVVQEHAEGGGTSATYAVSLEQAWEISKTVFRWEGCRTIEEHPDAGYMLTTNGYNPDFVARLVFRHSVKGAVMGAWLTAVGESTTEVTVVTKRLNPLSLTTGLTESTYHERFREAVVIVESAGSLPEDSP